MLINDLPPQVYELVSRYASVIQLGAVANISWHAVQKEASNFNTEADYIDHLRRINFRKMCQESEERICKDNLESRVERDLHGITVRTAMVATSLTVFEKLLTEAFTAGRLYEKSTAK